MNKHLLLCLLVVAFLMPATASNLRSKQQAMRAASERLPQASLQLTKTYSRIGEASPALYLYTGRQGGYVIVSADDRTPAVVGYSTEGQITAENMPPQMAALLESYRQQLAWLDEQGIEAPCRTNDTPLTDTVAPLLATAWAQGYPFNAQTPIYHYYTYDKTALAQGDTIIVEDSAHAATGCVATAMAQVINYHRYPQQGIGAIQYISSPRNYSLQADFAATTYDYDLYLNAYPSSATYTPQQIEAISTLLLHCGISAYMRYAVNGQGDSGSSVNAAMYGLTHHFGYDLGARHLYRDNYSADWDSTLRAELQASRPIIYGGTNSYKSGHCFVIDGFDTRNYFHVNWGWNGAYNGWFLSSLLDAIPGYPSFHFPLGQEALIGAQPECGGQPAEIELTDRTITLLHPDSGKSIVARSEKILFRAAWYNGSYSIKEYNTAVLIMSGDNVVATVEEFFLRVLPGEAKTGTYGEVKSDIPNGTYRVTAAMRTPNDANAEWQLMLGPNDQPIWYTMVATDTQYIFTPGLPTSLQELGIRQVSKRLENGQIVIIRNGKKYGTDGRIIR